MIIFIKVYKQVMSSNDQSNINAEPATPVTPRKKAVRTYNKCDYIMLTGVCNKNCMRDRNRCGSHYEKPQKNQMCIGECGAATASVTKRCLRCGQNRSLQKIAHTKRTNPIPDNAPQPQEPQPQPQCCN